MPVVQDGETVSLMTGIEPSTCIHLEGVTYPPERRDSMNMSSGALTTVLCMLRTKDKIRKNRENAVLKTLSQNPAMSDSGLTPLLQAYGMERTAEKDRIEWLMVDRMVQRVSALYHSLITPEDKSISLDDLILILI